MDYATLKFECKKFYPKQLVYELDMPKELLRKNQGLKNVHKLIDSINTAGVITRQELVSMMPPLLSDIPAHHSVFEMCAAPGSTSRLAEKF